MLKDVKSPIFSHLDLNPKNIYPLHETLDQKEDINYKFLGDYITYPKKYWDNREFFDWATHLRKMIKNELKNNLIYSLGILGYSPKNRSYITYGPHILITNKIVIKRLITYIEGQIESNVIDLESGYVDDEIIFVFFLI